MEKKLALYWVIKTRRLSFPNCQVLKRMVRQINTLSLEIKIIKSRNDGEVEKGQQTVFL